MELVCSVRLQHSARNSLTDNRSVRLFLNRCEIDREDSGAGGKTHWETLHPLDFFIKFPHRLEVFPQFALPQHRPHKLNRHHVSLQDTIMKALLF